MSYDPTNWKNGDVIVADKLNKIENGIKSIDDEYIVTNWQNGDIITADKSNKIENSIKSIDDEYTPTNWKNGDIITADKLNKIEQALAKQTSISTYELFPEQEYGMDTTSSPIRISAIQNVDYEHFVEGAEVSLTLTNANGKTFILTGFVEKAIPAEFGPSSEAPIMPMLYGTEETLLVYLANASIGEHVIMGINPEERSVSESGTDILVEKGLVSLIPAQSKLPISATVTIGKEQPEPIPTEIDITLPEGHTSPKLGLYVQEKADIDWGDGTEHTVVERDSTSSTSVKWSEHIYSKAGDYTIKVAPARVYDSYSIGDPNANKACLASNTDDEAEDKVYAASIKNVSIGSNVIRIWDHAFESCTNLDHVAVLEGARDIGDRAFASSGIKSITLSNSVQSISSSVFLNCSGLTSITLPASITSINSYVFSGCANLESVTFLGGIQDVSAGLFLNCSKLTNVTFAAEGEYKEIDSEAFRNCTSLEYIMLPEGVERIGRAAFQGCTKLKNITLPNSLTSLGESAFADCGIVNIVIPNGVYIGRAAFAGCTDLANISLPSTLYIIDLNTFKNCTSLTSIIIPDSVATLQETCFMGCTRLTSISLPSSVNIIGTRAFVGCTNISSYYVKNPTPPTLRSALVGADGFVIYIPTGSLEAYSAATTWSDLASKFVEMDM